jgi:ABC-type nitrate/sulfonate/bicarbonate transport system substrate-binding protein
MKLSVTVAAHRRRAAAATAALALGSALLTGCADSGAQASGSDEGGDSLFIATGGASANQLVPYLAEVLGYAEDEGLDLKVQSLEANVVSAVVAGRADMAEFGSGSALAPVSEGKDTALVFGVQAGWATGFVAAGDGIDDLSQCKRVSTHPRGSSAYSSAASYKKATGADYELVEFTTPTDVVASVLSGQSDCASSSLGILTPGLSEGLHLILDARDEAQIPPDSVQGTTGVGLWGMKDGLAEKKSATVKLMRALAKVQDYLETATPEEVATELVKHPDFAANEVDALAANVKAEVPFFFPNDGRILDEDWEKTLVYYQIGNPAIEPGDDLWSYDSRVDMSYFDEAAKS